MSAPRIPIEFLDAIRARVDLRQLVGRAVALKPATGGEWKGLCPFHGERTPSFLVVPRKAFYHCFGCGAHGTCFDWMTRWEGLGFLDAVVELAAEANLPIPDTPEAAPLLARAQAMGRAQRRGPPKQPLAQPDPAGEAEERERKIDAARRIWQRCQPAGGTLAERYLRARGCLAPDDEAPPSLRFHPSLEYFGQGPGEGAGTPSRAAFLLPAMVGVVTATMMGPEDGSPPGSALVGVHRTFLKVDGSGKAGVESPKKMLGACWGGAVRLGPVTPHLGLCEGIETGLSVRAALLAGALRLPGGGAGRDDFSIWCCLSLGAIGAIVLPPGVERLSVFADNDNKDPDKAAKLLGQAVDRHRRHGRAVTVLRPPAGDDFNDWWRRLRAGAEAAA